MVQPNSAEAMIKALEARVAKLENALQVSAGQIVLQAGSAKITLTSMGNIQITSGADIQMKAAGNIVMKANRIVQN
jgi:uncharacterized protein (DUF2345 family)